MKRIGLAVAIAAAAFACAQTPPSQNQNEMITSGPWMLRRSTGDQTLDRLYFIMDRSLNAVDEQTLRDMFVRMNPAVAHTIQKSILNAIDETALGNPNYGYWSNMDWMSNNGMTDIAVYDAMDHGLAWSERGVLHRWANNATESQRDAVGRLVRHAGWANALWHNSGMDKGS